MLPCTLTPPSTWFQSQPFITRECENSRWGLKLERLHNNLILHVCMLGWHISGPRLNSLNSCASDANASTWSKQKWFLVIYSTRTRLLWFHTRVLSYVLIAGRQRSYFMFPSVFVDQAFKLIVVNEFTVTQHHRNVSVK